MDLVTPVAASAPAIAELAAPTALATAKGALAGLLARGAALAAAPVAAVAASPVLTGVAIGVGISAATIGGIYATRRWVLPAAAGATERLTNWAAERIARRPANENAPAGETAAA